MSGCEVIRPPRYGERYASSGVGLITDGAGIPAATAVGWVPRGAGRGGTRRGKMSTNEPPAGAAHEGAPEYGQPQDPWAGGFDYTPGQSSVPTDPIPHQYDP